MDTQDNNLKQQRNNPEMNRNSMRENNSVVYDFFDFKVKKNEYLDVLWPCILLEVVIPHRINTKNNCNILENYIVKMLKLKKGDISETQKSLCLDPDLVKFIIENLKAKKILDENNIPLNDNDQTEIDGNEELVKYTLFIDELNSDGKLITFMYSSSSESPRKAVINSAYPYVEYSFDNEQSTTIKALRLPRNIDKTFNIETNESELKNNIRLIIRKYFYKQTLKNLSNTDNSSIVSNFNSVIHNFTNNLNLNNIDIVNYERTYVHTKAILELNKFNFMISEFDSLDYNLQLSSSINKAIANDDDQNPKFRQLNLFKQSYVSSNKQTFQNLDSSNTSLYSNNKCIECLKSVFKNKEKYKEIATNQSESSIRKESIESVTKKLYES